MLSSSTAQAVAANLPRQTQLAESLSHVQHVPAAISEQKTTIEGLKRRLEESEEKIGKLFTQTQTARKTAQASANPEPRKFTQLFTKKKAPVVDLTRAPPDLQLAYLSAMQEEMTERAEETSLQESLKSAEATLRELGDQAVEYNSLKSELRKVYNSVFDGPTIDFPEEDRLEHQLKASKAAYERVDACLQTDVQVAEALDQAMKKMIDCQKKIDQAHYWATISATAFGGDRAPDSNELLALLEASALMKKVQVHLDKARRLSSSVGEVKLLDIGADLLANPHDPKLHVKIKQVSMEVERISSLIQAERTASKTRLSVSKAVADEALQGCEAAQEELDNLRTKIFAEVAKRLQEGPITDGESTPPPSYNRHQASSASSSLPSPSTLSSPPASWRPHSSAQPPSQRLSGSMSRQPPSPGPAKPRFGSVPRSSYSGSVLESTTTTTTTRTARPLPRPPIPSP